MDMEQEEERTRLVFNFLYDHHLQMQEALATYGDDDEAAVLNTPVSFELAADRAPEAFLGELEFDSNMSFEAVEKLSRELADYFVELVGDMGAEVDVPQVESLLAEIEEMEREELKLVMRGIGTLRDF